MKKMVVFIQIYTYRCTVIQFTYIVKATYKSFKTRHPRSVQQQSDSACETLAFRLLKVSISMTRWLPFPKETRRELSVILGMDQRSGQILKSVFIWVKVRWPYRNVDERIII